MSAQSIRKSWAVCPTSLLRVPSSFHIITAKSPRLLLLSVQFRVCTATLMLQSTGRGRRQSSRRGFFQSLRLLCCSCLFHTLFIVPSLVASSYLAASSMEERQWPDLEEVTIFEGLPFSTAHLYITSLSPTSSIPVKCLSPFENTQGALMVSLEWSN